MHDEQLVASTLHGFSPKAVSSDPSLIRMTLSAGIAQRGISICCQGSH
jgi:hypothetical protein